MEKVVPAGELAPGAAPRRVTIAGFDVLVARLPDDRVVAFAATCPHQRTDLQGAAFGDGRIRCPLHLYEYDLGTGENVVPSRDLAPEDLRKAAPGYLRVHPVEERDGWIWVGGEPKPPPPASVPPGQPGAPAPAPAPPTPGDVIRVTCGTTFELRLPTTSRAGFVWRVDGAGSVVAVVGEGTEGGEHRVRLLARAAGRSTVRCAYARPWDREPAEVRTFDVVVVDPSEPVTPSRA